MFREAIESLRLAAVRKTAIISKLREENAALTVENIRLSKLNNELELENKKLKEDISNNKNNILETDKSDEIDISLNQLKSMMKKK